MTGILKKVWNYSLVLGLVFFVFLLFANWQVKSSAHNKTYDNVQLIPSRKVGVVLGTSPKLKDGRRNLYFDYRMQMAAALYKAGKVQYIVVSGDNRFVNYNEPVYMKNALVELGVPEENICMDFAGFTTYESMYRMHAIFGQNKFIVISQEFHNQRAIFFAQKLGLDVIGLNAKDVNKYSGIKTKLREFLSKGKAFILVWFKPKPTHLGEHILPEICHQK